MLLVPEGIVGFVRRKTKNYQSILQLATRRWTNRKSQGRPEKPAAFLVKR